MIEQFIIFFLLYWWLLGLLDVWQVRDIIKDDLNTIHPSDFYNFNPYLWFVYFLFLSSGAFCINCDLYYLFGGVLGTMFSLIALKWIFTRTYTIDILYKAVDCFFCFESHVALILAIPISIYFWEPGILGYAWAAKGLRMIIFRFIRE